MPEQIGNTNQVKLLSNENVVGTDGNKMKVPQIVRLNEFPELDLVSIQGVDTGDQDVILEVEVKGGTIESFCAMDFT